MDFKDLPIPIQPRPLLPQTKSYLYRIRVDDEGVVWFDVRLYARSLAAHAGILMSFPVEEILADKNWCFTP